MFFKRFVKFVIIDNGRLPVYKTAGAACADCYANEHKIIKPGERDLVKLGFAMQLPKNHEAVIRPRSGNTRVAIDIGEGTIDCDYTGEVNACVINNSHSDFIVNIGDRICQMKIQKAKKYKFKAVKALKKTERGNGGFGSTGKE